MFIAGLPRSRTAWLSVFMSQSDVYFYHEAINGCYSIDEYKDKIKDCGDSSTGFFVLAGSIITPNAKIVIIEKNKEELFKCIEWCDKVYGVDSKDFILDLNDKLLTLYGLIVKQSEINDRLQDIWEYLVDTPWDDKYSNLVNFNIQVQSADIDKKAAKALYASIQ